RLIVTERKGRVPKGATLSADENQRLEDRAIAELKRLPTSAWADMDALWRQLPAAGPSTRRRILARCLELAHERGDPLSAKFVRRFAGHAVRELAVKAPKARVHNQKALLAAVRCLAQNPHASLSDLAAAAGMPANNKPTIAGWKKRAEFNAMLR